MAADETSINRYAADFGHAHSIYFDALATSGLLGMITLVFVLFYLPFRYFYGYWPAEADSLVWFYSLGGMVFLVAFAIFGLTEAGWPGIRLWLHSVRVGLYGRLGEHCAQGTAGSTLLAAR